MRQCPKCAATFTGEVWKCPVCNWSAMTDGQITYLSQEVPASNENYDPTWYRTLANLEDGNFWFLSRNKLIADFVPTELDGGTNYLEIGCGTGFVLQHFQSQFPTWNLTASELHAEGLMFARDRVGEHATFLQMNAEHIPFTNEFDLIGAFDVIEHIREDEVVLKEMHQALRQGGYLLLTVPQHMWLWSQYDELGHHFRRYSSRELRDKLSVAGFNVERMTSFNALLIPLMYLSRLVSFRKQETEIDLMDELKMSPLTNALLGFVLRLEVLLTVRHGIRWPCGGSLVVLAKKI